MSRHPTKQLETVETVFAAREQSLARELARAQTELKEARDHLALLRSSQAEQARNATQTVSASEWANRAAFVARLNTAIGAQEQVVFRLELDCTTARDRLAASRLRTQAIAKVTSKRVAIHRRQLEQSEQRAADAASAGRRGSGGDEHGA